MGKVGINCQCYQFSNLDYYFSTFTVFLFDSPWFLWSVLFFVLILALKNKRYPRDKYPDVPLSVIRWLMISLQSS